ncbi:hypothetical protein B0H10DRAFT_2006784 [Mycena sp. CBHHK59/15]|nr:hypothetical protein B0H10DRAFT_2006784 [Mycena sp. CBHHK59/15]
MALDMVPARGDAALDRGTGKSFASRSVISFSEAIFSGLIFSFYTMSLIGKLVGKMLARPRKSR